MVLDTSLAQTGFPVASLLVVATVLLMAGLFLLRTARYLSAGNR
jgi:hypothetical protein